jgi:hypothetical protein
MPSTTDETLGRVGETLLVTVSVLATLGALGNLAAWLGTLAGVFVLHGVGYAPFGDWDWGPGGEARQHAVFFALLLGLNAALWSLPDVFSPREPTAGTSFLTVLGGVGVLALAGRLAYL